MRLEITTTWARIGINQSRPLQTIEQPKGELTIRQIKPEMTIHREPTRVLIDQSQCFAEAGLKSIFDFNREIADLGRQVALEYISRLSQEGDQFAKIEDGRKAREVTAGIAAANAYFEKEINVDFIPKSRPKIEVVGDMEIEWQLGTVEIDYQPNKPIHVYEPGKVEIYLRQQNSIAFHYIDERI